MTARVGMIVPSANTVVEEVTTKVIAASQETVAVHYTRIGVTSISLAKASAGQFGQEPMLAASRLLADAGVDVVAWNGTSGSWQGPLVDQTLSALVQDELGMPFTTSTLAILDAFRSLGVRRYGLAVPYTDDVREAIERVYSGEGLVCEASECLGLVRNTTFAELSLDDIRGLLRRADHPDAQAIAVVCTNVAAAWVIEEMEAELGKPIVDSTLVTLWHALRKLHRPYAFPGWGRLLAAPAG